MAAAITFANNRNFAVTKGTRRAEMESLVSMLRGGTPIYYVEGFADEATCSTIRDRFLSSPDAKQRKDDVPGLSLGAHSYGKGTEEYFAEVRMSGDSLRNLLLGTADPFERFRAELSGCLRRHGIALRPAAYRGVAAAGGRAVSWNGGGEYLLMPHDDVGPLYDPRQAEFEAQAARTHNLLAINFYPSAPHLGGELQVWDYQPDELARKRLGIEHTGYFYPVESLGGFDSVTIQPKTGDLVVLNGGYVHAVMGSKTGLLSPPRIVLNFFLGLLSDDVCAWWT